MSKYYTRLKIKISDKLDMKKLRYDVTVTYKSTSSRPGSEKPFPLGKGNYSFDSKGQSEIHSLSNRDVKEIKYYIKDANKNLIKPVTANRMSTSGRASSYKLKVEPASLMKDPDYYKIVNVDTTEVAWYLVKKQESVDSFLTRIYINPYRKDVEEVNFRANNSHLTGNPVLNLYPGDVVVLSNTSNSNNSDLQKMKKYAKLAKAKLEKLKKQKDFDPELFVYLSDMTTSALSDADFVGISSKPIPTEVTNTEETEESDKSFADYIVNGSSAAITFSSQANKDALKEFGKLITNYEEAQGTKSGNAKHFSQFRKDNASTYRALNNKLSLKFLQWDQGVRTDKLSKSIKSEMKRAKSFNGGLDAYVSNMEKNGKVTKALKFGGNLVVAYNVGGSSRSIYDGYKSKEKGAFHKAVAIEPLTLSGSVIGAEYGAAQGALLGGMIVAVTIGTGGIGGVLIVGISALIGGVGGGLLGGELGEMAGNIVYEKTRN